MRRFAKVRREPLRESIMSIVFYLQVLSDFYQGQADTLESSTNPGG
jgi:hypothetical protein